jgi:hypothetical protein
VIDGKALESSGEYRTTITVDDGEYTASVSTTLIVEPENATVKFDDDNPVAERVPNIGQNSGEFILHVDVKETVPDLTSYEAYPGNINMAEVSITLSPVGPGSPVTVSCTTESVTGVGYDTVKTVVCSFIDVPVNTYTVESHVVGGYYEGYSEDVLVIYDPGLGFTTGGGWFYWPGTDYRTNFGYTMKYNKKGQKVRGNLLLISHLPDGTKYRVKSNALYGLALGETTRDGETCGWASFSGDLCRGLQRARYWE